VTSARIEALRLAVAAEGRRALEEFWKEVAEETTPLVESIDGDPDHVVVTFLWRAEGEVAGVTVEGGPGGSVPTRLQFLPGTDLWHRSWRVPTDTRCTYRFRQNVTDPGDDPGALRQLWRDLDGVRTDPYNPREVRMAGPGGRPRYRRDLVSSLLELPGAPPQPWARARPEVRTGRVDEHELWSDVLGNERAVWVYTPPGYPADGAHYPVMVAFDGLLMVDATLALPTTLDNLGASGLVPPMVAVMVSNPDPPTRMRELPCHAPMVDFLAGDRWIRARVAGASRTTLLGDIVQAMTPLEPALLEASWQTLASAIADTSRRRSLVVLLTPLEPAAIEESLLPTLATLTRHHRVVLASVSDPALQEMSARRETTADAFDAAAAERTIGLRQRTAAVLGRMGVTVIDASPDELPPKLADHYLLLKSQGLL